MTSPLDNFSFGGPVNDITANNAKLRPESTPKSSARRTPGDGPAHVPKRSAPRRPETSPAVAETPVTSASPPKTRAAVCGLAPEEARRSSKSPEPMSQMAVLPSAPTVAARPPSGKTRASKMRSPRALCWSECSTRPDRNSQTSAVPRLTSALCVRGGPPLSPMPASLLCPPKRCLRVCSLRVCIYFTRCGLSPRPPPLYAATPAASPLGSVSPCLLLMALLNLCLRHPSSAPSRGSSF